MGRAIIAVLDSFGVGATADADRFGDVGSDTFGHIAAVRAESPAVTAPVSSRRVLMKTSTSSARMALLKNFPAVKTHRAVIGKSRVFLSCSTGVTSLKRLTLSRQSCSRN